jgi:hypothetical protein
MIKALLKIVAGSLLIMGVVLGLSFMSLEGAGAASGKEAACIGSGGKWTPKATPTEPDAGECSTPGSNRTVSNSIQDVINILIFVVGSVSVLMIIIGALRYTLAQGDSNAVNSAKNTIIYAIIGIVLSMTAYGLVNFVIVQLK